MQPTPKAARLISSVLFKNKCTKLGTDHDFIKKCGLSPYFLQCWAGVLFRVKLADRGKNYRSLAGSIHSMIMVRCGAFFHKHGIRALVFIR